jgi:hypothetical protein
MIDIAPLEAQHFECACHSPEHTLSFSWDDEENEIYTQVFLRSYHNFFWRVWAAIKYVFGYKCRYGHWDCFIMQSKDAQRLKDLLNKLE